MRRTYQFTGSILLCLAVYVGYESLKLRYYTTLGPGPGFFAFWLSLILGVLAAAMMLQATFGRPEPMPPDTFADRGGYLRVGAVALAILAAALLLERIGFRLTMFAVYFFVLRMLGKQSLLTVLVIALMGSFGVYFVFVRWLSVPLPVGVFGW
ncbi:MAG: tripartite tricarboxylate transporter TctB family protein [Betaproteobacteria bacterium]